MIAFTLLGHSSHLHDVYLIRLYFT